MIWVLDDNFKKIDILRKYTFSQYNDKFRDIGTFTINAEIAEENLFLLDKTKQHYILFDDKVFGTIDSVEKDSDGEFEKSIVITGRLALYIVSERVISKITTFKGNTAQYVRSLVNSELVSTENKRKIDFVLSYDDEEYLSKICSTIDKQVTGGYVFEEIQPYLEQDNIGVDIIPNVTPTIVRGGVETNIVNFDFIVMGGKDRRKYNGEGNEAVVFSQSLSNIERTAYSYDKKNFKDVAYVAGEGENQKRKWYEINRDGITETGWQRKELWIDARDIQSENEDGTVMSEDDYVELIRQRTMEKFAENNLNETYSSTIARSSKYTYGVDYYKGDLVTIIDDELGITVDAQVTGISVSVQGNREIVDVELTYGVSRQVSRELQPIVERISTTESNIKFIEKRIDSMFPIGSIVIRADDINPSRFYGGTWEKIAKGRTLVGVDETDTDFDMLGMAGGEKKHKLTENEMPSHTHLTAHVNSTARASTSGNSWNALLTNGANNTEGYANKSVATGGSQEHNNLQPYLTVNFWQRTI